MNYIIDYNVVVDGNTIYNKQIIVKNKSCELVAKVSLEDYLKRKYGNSFDKLIITSCAEHNNFMNWWNNMFKV